MCYTASFVCSHHYSRHAPLTVLCVKSVIPIPRWIFKMLWVIGFILDLKLRSLVGFSRYSLWGLKVHVLRYSSVFCSLMPVSQGNLSSGDSVPHMGNRHGLEEVDSKEGAIRRSLYTVCHMGDRIFGGTESPASSAQESLISTARHASHTNLWLLMPACCR